MYLSVNKSSRILRTAIKHANVNVFLPRDILVQEEKYFGTFIKNICRASSFQKYSGSAEIGLSSMSVYYISTAHGENGAPKLSFPSNVITF